MKKVVEIFVLLVLAGFFNGNAQVKEFNFKKLPNMKELSSHSVSCMAQDSTGFIWVGTADGLNRYNGYEVKVYVSNGKSSIGLTSNEISSVFVDSKNRIWVGTQQGLSVYDPDNDRFIPISSAVDSGGLRDLYITSINEDLLGRVIVAAGNNLYFFDEKLQKFRLLLESPVGPINTFAIDSKNGIWYGLDDGSLKYFLEDGLLLKNPVADNLQKGDGSPITGLVIRNNHLWISYRGKGVIQYHPETKESKYYLQDGYERYVFFVYLDRLNRLWVCDYTGLKLLDERNDSFYGYYHNPAELNSIRPNIEGIFLDRQGNYYFYYRGEGVYVSYTDRGFKQFDTSALWYWHVKSPNIMAIGEEANGNLWLGGYNGGVDVFDWINGRMVRFNNGENDPIRLGIGSLFVIYCDSEGLMWFGSHSGGLRSYNTETGQLKIYQHSVDDPESIIGNDVRSISEDLDGNIWVGVHGKGVSCLNRHTEKFKNYNYEKNGLAVDWVESVLCDSRGYLWVGTTNGLSMLSPGDSLFKNFMARPDHSAYLQGSRVICLHQSKNENILVGTNDGLYEINHNNYEFKRLGINARNQYICSIEEDHNGVIWFSTLGGLYRLNSLTGEMFHYSENDGLQADGFNIRASFYNGKTELFFAGTKGVNLFNPDELHFNNVPPKIVLSKFILFNKEINDYKPGNILEKHISATNEIVLDYHSNVFTIEFTALNMINPELNVYAYMMEGFDTDWNYVGTKREATYTNLNPGKYTFRVKAANNDGVWNEEGIALQIRVLPPWYRTILFYIIVILVVISMPVVYYRLRTVVLRRQKKRLTHLVAENTRKLRKNNEALKQRTVELNRINYLLEERQQIIEQQSEELEKQAQNLQLRNEELHKLNQTKDRLFSIIAHDLRAPFNTILGFSSLLIESKEHVDKEQVTQHARYIHDASLQVYNLLENLLYWARSQTNEINYVPANSDLNQIVIENIDLIRESVIKKNININTENYINIPVYMDVDMMKTVVRNLIINAVKFTAQGGTVSISSEKNGNKVKLSIADTGVGINNEDLQLLTKPGHQKTTKGTDGERGSGLGLVLCNEFVTRNKGRLIIESKPGEGSVFSILLPSAR